MSWPPLELVVPRCHPSNSSGRLPAAAELDEEVSEVGSEVSVVDSVVVSDVGSVVDSVVDSVVVSLVVVGEGVKPADFEAIWDNPKKVGDYNCGELSSTTQCAGETGGTTYLITSASGSSASEVSKILGEFLKAV